jgi:hypothetical protein
MPLASTGTISLSQIQTEFGGTNPISMSEYYTNSGTGFTSGITGLPATGTTISMSAFRGKQKSVFITTTLASGAVMATYLPTVAHIDEIPYASFSSLTGVAFYLKYTISTSAGAQTIVVSCRNSTRISRIAQSCFTMNNTTLTFGTARRYNWIVNDDHDTLFMDGTGSSGYISRTNTDILYDATGFGKFSITNSVFSFDAGNNQPQGYPGSGTFSTATVVAFPATSRTLYFNTTNYIINGLTAQTWNSTVTSFLSGVSSFRNMLTTVSDGVNSVLVIRGTIAITTGLYLTFNLTTGVMISATSITFTDVFDLQGTGNDTEEDAVGNQLFSIDGSTSYYKFLKFYYTTRSATSVGNSAVQSFLDGSLTANSSTNIGTINTSTGMDILTTIDAGDGYAYFVDWGHDNGGLFDFGDDSALGYTKTNIFKIPSNFTGVSPARVDFISDISTTTLASGAIMATYTTAVVTHIDEIPYSSFSSLTGVAFYLKYRVSTSTGIQTIVVSCRNSTRISRIAQSCFSMNNATLTYGTAQSYFWTTIDDHDTLFMDGTGSSGFISSTGTSDLLNLAKFTLANSVFTFNPNNSLPQGFPGAGDFTNATVVAFPATSYTLYFTKSYYIINGFSSQIWNNLTVTNYLSSWSSPNENKITTVSDGVNSVLVILGTAVSTGIYLTFNLTTGLIISATNITFVDTFAQYNNTEQDTVGNQLFAIDGSTSYYRNLNFYYTTRSATSVGNSAVQSFLDGAATANSVTSIGTIDTETGMDILTTIDAGDGYAYFADWGHDSGGLFGFGDDNTLGYTKTNIFKIPNTFTGVSPTRTNFPAIIVNANRTSVNVTSLPSNVLLSVKNDDGTFTFTLDSSVIPFNIAGNAVTNINICSNCYIQFDSSNRFNYAFADRYAYKINYEYLNSAIGNHLRIVCWHGYAYGSGDETSADLRFEIKFYRDSTYQYIEAKANDTMKYSGNSTPSNTTDFQGITLPVLTSGTSYVLRSDLNGNNWTLTTPAYMNV